jgi:radical SAM protein with 4Fe4S-binding SPASM domain
MEMELYKKIIDEIKNDVYRVGLSGLGEPLINPKFFDYVDYAKKCGLEISFYSNGLLLDEEKIEQIVKYDIDSISFSIDCLPEHYEFYSKMKNVPVHKARKQLEKLIEHIELLSKRLKEEKRRTKLYAIRMDAPGSTPWDLYVEFCQERDWIPLSGGVIDWGGTIDRVNVSRSASKEYVDCAFIYYMYINSDGSVAMCHIDYNTEHCWGNVAHQTVAEVYNSDAARSLRRRIYNNEVDDLPCQYCNFDDFSISKRKPILQTSLYWLGLSPLSPVVDWLKKIRRRMM